MVNSAKILVNVMNDIEWRRIIAVKGYLKGAKEYLEKAKNEYSDMAESGRRAVFSDIINSIKDVEKMLENEEKNIVYKYFLKEIEGGR